MLRERPTVGRVSAEGAPQCGEGQCCGSATLWGWSVLLERRTVGGSVLKEPRTVGRVSAEGAPHCGRVSAEGALHCGEGRC